MEDVDFLFPRLALVDLEVMGVRRGQDAENGRWAVGQEEATGEE